MAYMKLNADLTEVTFTQSRNKKEEVQLMSGEMLNRNVTENTVIAQVPVTADLSKIDGLTDDEAIRFRKSIDQQIVEVNEAFANNAKNGIFGGYPVIKKTKKDDEKYANHFGYKPGRKIGEFIGVVEGAKFRTTPVSVAAIEKRAVNQEADLSTNKSYFVTKKEEGNISEFLTDRIMEICDYMATTQGTANQALTIEEVGALFKAERLLFLLVTQGLGYKQKELEDVANNEHRTMFDDLVKSSRSTCYLRSTRLIPAMLAEYDAKQQ